MPENEQVVEVVNAEGGKPETAVPEAGTPESKEGGFTKRINKLTKRAYEAESERDRLRDELEELKRGRQAQPEHQESKQSEDPFAYPVPKPKASDFETPQDFVEALAEWKVDAREYRNARIQEEQSQRDARQEVFDAYNERVAASDHEDFEEVVGKSEGKLWPQVLDAILEHEEGPEIAYYLAKNPDETERLAEMSPLRAVAALDGILAKAKSPSSPESKPKPRTINPVGGTSKTSVKLGELSFQDYKKARLAMTRG